MISRRQAVVGSVTAALAALAPRALFAAANPAFEMLQVEHPSWPGSVWVSHDAPSKALSGDIWIATSDRLKHYVFDGDRWQQVFREQPALTAED